MQGIGGMVGMSRENSEIKRNPQVLNHLEIMEKLSTRLHEVISEHETKVQSITRMNPPIAESVGKDPQSLVPLADHVRRICFSIDGAIKRIEDINSRIEI